MVDFKKYRVLILASGSGSNAGQICRYFTNHKAIEVVAIGSNRKQAGVFDVARTHGIPSFYLAPTEIKASGQMCKRLQSFQPDLIVLAGYLKLIPKDVLECYPNRVMNIHPALLPKYGGPGMYGMRVHEAVQAANEKISGPTIHLANEVYDKGRILFQASTVLDDKDDASQIQRKVLTLEHRYYPMVIESFLIG